MFEFCEVCYLSQMLNNIDIYLTYFSGISFILYGFAILLSDHMVNEFKRYNMLKFRTLTGILELLGGGGLLVGLLSPFIGCLSSFGLGLLMLLGSLVRLRLKDPILKILPAIIFMILNFYLFYSY